MNTLKPQQRYEMQLQRPWQRWYRAGVHERWKTKNNKFWGQGLPTWLIIIAIQQGQRAECMLSAGWISKTMGIILRSRTRLQNTRQRVNWLHNQTRHWIIYHVRISMDFHAQGNVYIYGFTGLDDKSKLWYACILPTSKSLWKAPLALNCLVIT